MNRIIYGVLAIVLITSCDASKKITENNDVTKESPQPKETSESKKGNGETIDLEYMDQTVRPQDDFFLFANGTWLKENPVPASEGLWGSFNELDQANNKKLNAILEEFKKTEFNKGDFQQILGDYYKSYMDMESRNDKGISAVEKELDYINSIVSKSALPSVIARLHKYGIGSLFHFGVEQDMKDVDNHIVSFNQGGIGLPNKEYYFEDSKKDILEKYDDFVANMFKLLGEQKAGYDNIASTIVEFESALAAKMMTPVELRSPELTYNKMSRLDAIKVAGSFDLEAYIRDSGIESFDTLVVEQPEFLKNLSIMVDSVSLVNWRLYLKWCVLNHYADHLDDKFINANFDFYGKVLSGRTELKPIHERAIREITRKDIGELLGKAFVGRYFSENAQRRVNEMVDNLLIVFGQRIDQLDWMSETTRKEARIKLEAIGRKLGFPSNWKDFSMLDIRPDDYIHNIRETAKHAREQNIKKLNEPVDKSKWGMPAHMVNAYYHPLLNEIVFPAGIMQPPFFSEKYEDAVNYGRMGMVIGHEFTHGFDDKGSKFAADGTFKNWWTDKDRSAFELRTELFGQTYSGFCPAEGHCVNPNLTMGENIADLGGLTLAYNAYTLTDEFKSGEVIKGFSPGQRFFIAYAQLWKINYKEEALKNLIATDPHAPGMCRVNGPLMNCPEFFKEFNVQESDPMRNPEEKCPKIW